MVFVIAAAAFLASLLTLFSGFGLGTILTPVFGLFFPLHVAVALTGVVHLANNLFKLALLGRQAARHLVLRFGPVLHTRARLSGILTQRNSRRGRYSISEPCPQDIDLF
ncbi:MAG TPA: hypothetical protein PKH44_13805 [Plasticicumulans sp.]|nr:hypothetical protein [Plasticicumulans sp.]